MPAQVGSACSPPRLMPHCCLGSTPRQQPPPPACLFACSHMVQMTGLPSQALPYRARLLSPFACSHAPATMMTWLPNCASKQMLRQQNCAAYRGLCQHQKQHVNYYIFAWATGLPGACSYIAACGSHCFSCSLISTAMHRRKIHFRPAPTPARPRNYSFHSTRV